MPVLPLRSMRRAGRFCAFLTCVSLAVLDTATAASDPTKPVETPLGDVQSAVENGVAGHDSLQAQVHALPPGIDIRRHVVSGDGTVTGQPAAVGESTLIYSNTLGNKVFGPEVPNTPFADDIATTGVAGCPLDRYEFLVSGDARGDGSGSGPFGVDFALYDGCPGGGASVIAGTEGHAELPDEGYHLIVFHAPFEVALPSRFWFQVAFSREHAGVVLGAPPLLGYSMDRLDYPGYSCAAGMGGHPYGPHASFNLEVYTRGACANSFVAYQNTKDAGDAWSAGASVFFADDVHLAVRNCNMVGYELAHKGDALVRVDLRTQLDDADPAEGGLIPGTETMCVSVGDELQHCRARFDPPIPIPRDLWVAYRSSSSIGGPILTCTHSAPGTTENVYEWHRDGRWQPAVSGGYCWAGFELTIFCEGQPPTGACCDMYFTDEENEAICRELPQMNCAFPELWEEGGFCLSECEGGEHDGKPCSRQTDCPGGDCPGPFAHPCGQSACCKPDDTCENLTENECDAVSPVEFNRLYRKGSFCAEGGQQCPFNACLQRVGDCSIARPETGCEDPYCCSKVCEFDSWCCEVAWDELCLRWSQEFCGRQPNNDRCGEPLEVDTTSGTVINTIHASSDANEDSYCCHRDEPEGAGLGSVWFMFEATHTSARIHTCNTSDPGKDSLIMVYRDLDSQLTPWSVCDVDGRDGIACSDDAPGCGDGLLSDVCVTDLVPGERYFVALAGKTEDDPGVYHLDIESPCIPTAEGPPNDYCHHAEAITEGVTPFDLAGATFDCPGPPPSPVCLTSMLNDLWYEWTASCAGQAIIETCGESDDDTPNTSLVVYGECDCLVDSESILGCSDFQATPCLLGSRVEIDAQEGHCYKIRLGGYLGGEPAGNLTITNCPTSCPAGALTFVDPPDGVVDARQPHPIGTPTALQGIDSIIVAAPDGAIATCFTLCETSGSETLHPPYQPGFESNEITGVEANGDGTYTVILKRPITPGEVTTVTYRDNNGTTTTGSFIAHPADVNADSGAGPSDILAIIDIISGVQTPLWGAYSSDIDHSGIVGPPDILRVIDQLNAGWLNTALPTNPGTCP